ncbi:MAG: hypothetical protein N3A02_06495, partial [Rectinema sp.]|nr:hypothetical protein [Rectinema sp.]
GFDHLFSSRLFLIIVALFTTNLTVCTVHRLGNELAKPRAARRHGPDFLHLGLIIIIFGSILTARTRSEQIFHAGAGQHIHLPDGKALYLTRLEQETYESGRVRTWITEGIIGQPPAEAPHGESSAGDTLGEEGYASELGSLGLKPEMLSHAQIPAAPAAVPSVSELPGGTPVVIKVNAPYRGKGYTIYQYDWKTISLPVLADPTGMRTVLQSGSRLSTPEESILFMAIEQPPAPQGSSVEARAVFLEERQGARTIIRARLGDQVGSFKLAGYETQYLSGLKIKSDPWFPLVLAGIFLAMAGTLLTYLQKLKGLST